MRHTIIDRAPQGARPSRCRALAPWAISVARDGGLGTSMNVLSKTAQAVTGTRTVRVRRLAASSGCVGTELAKEVPYYEYGLARLTRAVLRWRA